MPHQIRTLSSRDKRSAFNCGILQLDNYLKKQAKQDIKKGLSICFVLTDDLDNVIGYYTLSNFAIDSGIIPEQISKKFPASYEHIPTTLLGRLGIDQKHKGKGLGELLLIDALVRSYEVANHKLGSIGIIVDPINESAKRFYKNYGFIELHDSAKMFLPMKTIERLLKEYVS